MIAWNGILDSKQKMKLNKSTIMKNWRTDEININWLKWIVGKKDVQKGKMMIWTKEIPIKNYKFKPPKKKFLHPFWGKVKSMS